VAAGVQHKNSRIAIAATEALAEMAVPGTTKMLAPMLDPPKTPDIARQQVYTACIEAAAKLREPSGLPYFEKLLKHPDRDFAVAGAKALAGYWLLDSKPLIALVARLAPVLERTDAALAKAMNAKEKDKARIKHLQALRDGLTESLRKLTDDKRINSAADCRKWCKKKRQGNM